MPVSADQEARLFPLPFAPMTHQALIRQPRSVSRAARVVAWLTVIVTLGLVGPCPTEALQVTGLRNPQNFLTDGPGDQYFISNVNGDPDVKDNNGFISKLDRSGNVVNLHFIQGGDEGVTLHAPKGMAIVNRTLYVADLDAVRAFDVTSGVPVRTISFDHIHDKKASTGPMLAELASDDNGLLYVTDTEAHTIYRVDTAKQHAVSIVTRDPSLAGPRGIAVHPKTGHLIVVSWDRGKILDVTPQGHVVELVSNSFFSARFHNLDGVAFDGWGNMYVSDFTGGKIWRMRPNNSFDVIAEYLPAPAGIAIDREKHLILVPYYYADAAEINGLESPKKKGSAPKRNLADYGLGWFKPEQSQKEGPAR